MGKSIGLFLALGAALGFSAKAILVKLAFPYGVTPIALLALRMVFSVPAFLWVGLRHPAAPRPDQAALWGVLACGLAGYYSASLFDFLGLQYISAGLERLILFTYPTLTVVVTTLLHGTPLTRRLLGALGLTYAGIGLAFMHDLDFMGDRQNVLMGSGLVFLSAVCYAGYLVGSGSLIGRLGAARFSAWALLISTCATLGHFVATEPVTHLLHQPWPVYALALAMAIFSTVLPIFMQSVAIRHLGAGPAAIVGSVGPLLTIFLGWWILEEPGSLWQLAGAALVLTGVWQIGRR